MDTLKPGNEQKPEQGKLKTEAYRPAGSLIHKVSDGENWSTLAARFKREAKLIIKDNFETDQAYEINWYLGNYVKCDKATADRYNWRFSTSSRNRGGLRPGIIYIVPNWYAIVSAAKFLALKAMMQWFTGAFLKPFPVEDNTIRLRGHNLGFLPTFLLELKFSMRLQGATDDLADAWVDAMHKGLEQFSQSIDSVATIPLPQLMPGRDWHPGSAVVTWNGLKGAITAFDAFLDIAQVNGAGLDNEAARVAIVEFGRWWERRLDQIANRCVTEVFLTGTYNSALGIWRAVTVPGQGCIRGVAEALSLK